MHYISISNWQPTSNIQLTSEQNNALKITDKNIAIIAGPGTGKTELLAQKATYLLQTGICSFPFRILALSYKVDAASNIRERVKRRCPKDLAYRFSSMTVDAFIISLIRRFATSLPDWLRISVDFEIIDKIDDIEYLRSTNASSFPNEYHTDVSILQNNVSNIVKQFYLHAAEKNIFDYDMCHTMAYYIVSNNPRIRLLISKTYKYIFWDEFQDMTFRHYDILKCIFNDPYNKICAVGDDKQAIMAWAGAIPDIFNRFKNDFSTVTCSFTYNYRSTSQIVEFINTVVCKLTPEGLEPTKYNYPPSTQNKNSFISAQSFNSIEDEATYIAKCINNLLEDDKNLTPCDFAIILKQKTADYLSHTKETFTQYNILVRNEDEKICKNGLRYQDLMVDNYSKLIIGFLKLKMNIISIVEQNELFYNLSNILSLDIEKSRNLKKLHNIINDILQIDFTDVEGWLKQISYILPKTKIQNKLYMNKKEFNTAQLSVSELLKKCFDNTKKDLRLTIDEYLGTNFVKLMTTHKSKGLEFDTVFFADFRENSWWSLTKSQKDKEESLRCFFVGLSRAKTRLFFTSPTTSYPKEIADILNNSKMVINYNPH